MFHATVSVKKALFGDRAAPDVPGKKNLQRLSTLDLLKVECEESITELEKASACKEYEPYAKTVGLLSQLRNDTEIALKGSFVMAYNAIDCHHQVINAGGLEEALQLMKLHPNDHRIQQECLEMLRYIAEQPDGADMLLDLGVLQMANNSMTVHPEAQWVQQEGLGLFAGLTTCERGMAAVLKSQGIETTVRIMETYSYSWVQMWGCQILARYAAIYPQRVEQAGGFEAAESARRSKECMKSQPAMDAAREVIRLKPRSSD